MQSDAEGMAELRRLGARTVPVVARGQRWVSGQVLDEVATLVGVDGGAAPALAPRELIERLDRILSAAQRYLRQFTPEQLACNVRNRERPLGVLGHHIFRIPEAFLETAAGATLEYDSLVRPPPEGVRSGEDIAAYGQRVRDEVRAWWAAVDDPSCQQELRTYYGPQSVHELLERTTWHAGQHVRQLLMVLSDYGIVPDDTLGPADFEGLPMPEKVWDD